MKKFIWIPCFIVGVVLLAGNALAAMPFNLYLTYGSDPSASVVVNFHTEDRLRDSDGTHIYYDVEPRKGDLKAYRHHVEGQVKEIPELPVYRTLHWAEITGLQPLTVYYFSAGNAKNGFSEERAFRTLPSGEEPIRFATGGDMNVNPLTVKLLAQGGKKDPAFCAIGGDIAYVNGRLPQYPTWDTWFQNYDTHMRAPDGRMIPMFVAIGNHETNRLPSTDPKIVSPFYQAFFAEQQSGGSPYFLCMFGKNIALLALDSGHTTLHGGAQSAWLAETLDGLREVPYKFAIYHVPLYPSHRAYEGEGSRLGRVHWEPLFAAYRLTAAFENHDHTLKRSKLLKNGEVAEEGVLYIGDGCFGVDPRTVDDELRWYLEMAQSTGHVWLVEVNSEGVAYRAIGEDGAVLDEYRQARVPQGP